MCITNSLDSGNTPAFKLAFFFPVSITVTSYSQWSLSISPFAAWVLYTILVIIAGLVLIAVVILLKYKATRVYIFNLALIVL